MTTFVDIETVTRTNAPPKATLSYLRGGKKAEQPSLKIVLPTTITGQAAKDATFKLQFSTGPEFQLLRVTRAKDKTGVKPGHMKWASRFNFGYVPILGDDKFDNLRCPVTKVDDHTFDIRLPADFITPPKPGKVKP